MAFHNVRDAYVCFAAHTHTDVHASAVVAVAVSMASRAVLCETRTIRDDC